MISNISEELNPKFKPVVLIKSDEKPSNAVGPESLVGGCAMAYFAKAVVERKTTFFGHEYSTCAGISSGLGWIEELNELALDFQATFLSLGIDSAKNKENYLKMLENKSERVKEMFLKGERFYKDYETAYLNIKSRPLFNNGDYAIFKPIEMVNDDDKVLSVIFTVNVSELIALMVLDGSHRTQDSYILTPQSSGCQAIGCHVFN